MLELARRGEAAGCTEALFTLGERPELRYPDAAAWLAANGHASTVEYLAAACAAVLERRRCCRTRTPGRSPPTSWPCCATVVGEPGDDARVAPRRPRGAPPRPRQDPRAPPRHPRGRRRALDPVHDGRAHRHRRGAGPTGSSRSRRSPRPTSATATSRRSSSRTSCRSRAPQMARVARRTARRARAGRSPRRDSCSPTTSTSRRRRTSSTTRCSIVEAGADDLGGISPVTLDHVNPERAWPQLDGLDGGPRRARATRSRRGSPSTPRSRRDPARWLDPALRTKVLQLHDAEGYRPRRLVGLGRHRGAAAAARPACPATLDGAVAEVLGGVALGHELGEDELGHAVRRARPRRRGGLRRGRRAAARDSPATTSPGSPTATSTTPTSARSSAGSARSRRAPCRSTSAATRTCSTSTRSRGASRRPRRLGCTEVCLQGGIHPSFDGEYYLDVLRAVRQGSPSIHIHAFSALEVFEGARRSGASLAEYLERLKDAGLRTLPGHRRGDPGRRGAARSCAPTR